jgi:hypothetical protein
VQGAKAREEYGLVIPTVGRAGCAMEKVSYCFRWKNFLLLNVHVVKDLDENGLVIPIAKNVLPVLVQVANLLQEHGALLSNQIKSDCKKALCFALHLLAVDFWNVTNICYITPAELALQNLGVLHYLYLT